MATQNTLLKREKYSCSICLELLSDPVSLSCGHSYCLGCITDQWNSTDVKAVYSCPQCRQPFAQRPALVKNTVLADLMEDIKMSELQDGPPDQCYAGQGDVACDVCTGRKTKAVKSCLVCLASFCEQHIKSHYQVSGLKRHNLVEPTVHFQDNICPRHDEVMKMFCLQDCQGICHLCAVDEHKGHNTISAKVERNKKQKDLSGHQKASQDRIQNIEDDVQALEQVMASTNRSADKAIESADEIFAQLICCIERRWSKVQEQIRTKQRVEVGRVLVLQNIIEQKLTEMKKSLADLDQLAQTEDNIHFLQNYPQNLSLSEYRGLANRDALALQYFGNVTESLSKTQDNLEVFLDKEMFHFSLAMAGVDVLILKQPPQPSGFQPRPKFNSSKMRFMTRPTSQRQPNQTPESPPPKKP